MQNFNSGFSGQRSNRRLTWLQCALPLVALPVFLPHLAPAQTVTATVAAGTSPVSVAVNPVTNKMYVADQGSNQVTVIDGATNSTRTVAVGTYPQSVAVNPVTNKIYVANYFSSNVTVIDGATNTTSTVAAGTNPYSVAVNPVTNKIYVANPGSHNVTVIDGATNNTASVPAGDPISVAVNPVTNKIYVANYLSANVTVIDGATNSITTVAAGTYPISLAVNAVTNKIYVANDGNSLTVIDGATNSIATVAVAGGSYHLAVNPVTNKIYVAPLSGNTITLIDGATNSTAGITVAVGGGPISVAVDPVTNQIYVSTQSTSTVTVIDGATYTTTTLTFNATTQPIFVAVNPVTNKIYVANESSNNVTVIDGASNDTTTVNAGLTPISVAANPVTNKIYVANQGSHNVTVIDGATDSTATVNAGTNPQSVAMNPVSNKIYVVNYGSNNVTVIDGATNTTDTVPAGINPQSVAVNPVTNKIYVANPGSNNVTVIDGATDTTSTVAAGSVPNSVAVNPVTNKIYVANYGSGNVTVIDGATNTTTAFVVAGSNPYSVAVNPVTNKIYVANYFSANITVIDGATNTTTTVAAGTYPYSVAVNPVTNKIYVANYLSANITVIDGTTNTAIATLSVGSGAVAVNPVTNKIYVVSNINDVPSNNVTVIDGATNTTTAVAVNVGTDPSSVVVNPVTNRIYVANAGSGNVTVIKEASTQAVPLTTAITPLANNQSTNPVPGFTFTATSTTVTQPDALFYQFDTWQSAWTAASGSNPTFTGSGQVLQPGFHILYAYATDGQESAATEAGSPLVGSIQAYGFLVTSTQVAFVVLPVQVTVGTNPGGLSFMVDGATYSSSQMFTWNAGDSHTIATSTPQAGMAGTQYVFTSWSDGGTLSHNITVSAATTSYTASFTASSGGPASFVTGQTPGLLRNNYSGFVGMEFTVGSSPTMVSSLGRYVVASNTQSHLLKLVQANGIDVPGGSVLVATSGAAAGAYQYAALANPVTLLANTSYFVVSQETAGGDQWYDYGPVSTAAIANVLGPAYTDGAGNYVTVTVLPGRCYVPVSFLYASGNTSLSVNITSPAANSTIFGTASITVSTTGPVTSLQVQVDGVSQGSPVPVSVNQGPSYTLSLDTMVLSTGGHSLTVVANGSVTSPAVTVTVSNPPGGSAAFVLGQTPGPLRNNYTGFVGMSLQVGSTPVVVASLGRFAAPNNTGTHLVKLVNANGTDVTGGSVSISMAGSTPGTFQYAALPAGPFTLQAKTTYYLVSQETAGGDQWYDYGKVSASVVATVTGPTYTDGGGHYVTVGGLGGDSYVPVSFLYGPTTSPVVSTTSFVTSQSASSLRNNYSGFVGMNITVGATPLSVVSLGRYAVSGNSGTHVLKLVQANGTDVPGGSVTLSLTGAAAGQYAYAALPATVTLAANTTYYLVSQETAGGDMWYDLEPITTTAVAQVVGPTYTDGGGHYVTVGGFPGYSYVPLNFQYQ